MKKQSMILAAVLCAAVCFAGCGCKTTDTSDSQTASEKTEATKEKTEAPKLNIADIDWHVDEGVVDGERYVLLDYTNNTPYTISDFKLTFKEKGDLTEEEKTAFYSDIQKKLEASDADMKELKAQPITMHAETERVVNAGEAVSNVNCYYYEGSFYLKDISHYALVEPDIATVKYIDADKVYTVYYDYGSQKTSAENKTEAAYQWSQTDLGTKLPKPDVKLLKSSIDNDKTFMFDAYGMTSEQFNAYVEDCKKAGYTVDPSSFEGFYSADNAEGYNVYLHYDEKSCSMDGSVRVPEKEGE